jgi:hypothetical protein
LLHLERRVRDPTREMDSYLSRSVRIADSTREIDCYLSSSVRIADSTREIDRHLSSSVRTARQRSPSGLDHGSKRDPDRQPVWVGSRPVVDPPDCSHVRVRISQSALRPIPAPTTGRNGTLTVRAGSRPVANSQEPHSRSRQCSRGLHHYPAPQPSRGGVLEEGRRARSCCAYLRASVAQCDRNAPGPHAPCRYEESLHRER